MKTYTIQVGEVFTEEKAKELQEYLEAKDKDVEEKIQKEIDFIEEGIQACKDDSAKDDCKGNELQYIFGKSQALKIMKSRLEQIITPELIN